MNAADWIGIIGGATGLVGGTVGLLSALDSQRRWKRQGAIDRANRWTLEAFDRGDEIELEVVNVGPNTAHRARISSKGFEGWRIILQSGLYPTRRPRGAKLSLVVEKPRSESLFDCPEFVTVRWSDRDFGGREHETDVPTTAWQELLRAPRTSARGVD